MAVKIVRRETIKPSSPTPPNLKIFKLSFLDQIAPPVYTSLVLFYPTMHNTDNINTISDHLKKSLSEALSRFPQLAGRIDSNDATAIECTDDGAQYIEAKFNGILSTFLDQPNEPQRFIPAKVESPEAATGPLLLVQATFFDRGGLAIGVCVSHKFADAATLSIFLKSWSRFGHLAESTPADLNPPLSDPIEERRPDLKPAAVVMPPNKPGFPLPGGRSILARKIPVEYVSKRYVFDKSKIAALRAKATSDGVKQPTRVEVVTALVWKCAINSSRLNLTPDINHYGLFQLVDIRKKVEPPFPENSTGNLVGFSNVQVEYNKEKLELQGLVAKLRKEVEEFSEKEAKRLGGDEATDVVSQWSKEVEELTGRDDVKSLLCDSWCDYGFYEVDFGWGKPIWASRPSSSQKNNIFTLMDTKESGGVEVGLTLSKKNMASFERDPELIAFAAPL
ncbi:Transferase [Parasponia andersonii]|uniref:Transferase n=1 Tax=Parasponia andersonii TaxID=3476 RepID=A0A2P5CUM2_PARAD|nr:Transferase [Parasponia andersonii]